MSNIELYDYTLPEDRIAQYPLKDRDSSRLLVVHRDTGKIEHRRFNNILEYLNEGDCLVLNNSKVIHARLIGAKQTTNAKIEILLIKRIDGDEWEVMIKPAKRLKIDDIVVFSDDFRAQVTGIRNEGLRSVKFIYDGIFMERLEELGKMPLPPYIKRDAEDTDDNRYQTVYSEIEGSVAAPTAGLHFTEGILKDAKSKGIDIAYLTLHVGLGTFRPVQVDKIEDHKMHSEWYEVTQTAADKINNTKAEGGRVICVGTTAIRTTESAYNHESQKLDATCGETDIFIYPGYEFKVADSLITNFHLPKSTLMMLISAFYDREKILKIYEEAIAEEYRFFSYGDAMLLI